MNKFIYLIMITGIKRYTIFKTNKQTTFIEVIDLPLIANYGTYYYYNDKGTF